ncbi:copper chaperone PCu(A)C [uncultured Sphingomonas sp.]|uniref:copper chaperone PCu(A)C n=1 Tax=uncultured Sphingomonas sp. TaxID=158754 RepID=UPI0025CB9027|nr:copper chaperone PCu(A)C [uncultured Sphingomonas sp.]
MKRILAGLTCAVAVATPVLAHEFKLGSLEIAHPWTRQTAPGQRNGGGFLVVTNKGRAADQLVDVASPVADKVELHTMSMDGGIMRMRPVTGGLPIPAGGTLTLAPGGYHVMLIGLKAPLTLGTMVPLTLRFARAGTITVQLKVEPVSFTGEAAHEQH